MNRTDTLGFFGRHGYALAALSALTWAASALQDPDSPDRDDARTWVQGGSGAAAGHLTFDLCVQALGMSSRREELRHAMVEKPGEPMARLLMMQQLMEGGDEGVPGDPMESLVRMQRAIHLEGAPGPLFPRLHHPSEQTC